MKERDDDPICLVVDDSEFDRKMIARAIRRAELPFRIRVATSLDELRKCMGHRRVKALILDNSLPDGRGIDFAMRHVADPWFRPLLKIMVTDFPSPFIFEKSIQAGFGDVMLKSELSPAAMRAAFRIRSRLG